MTRPAMLGLVRKEAQALWLLWAGCAAVITAAAASGLRPFIVPSQVAFFVGSVSLAAMTIGHEYAHRTLPALLALPVDRRRLMAAKLLALMPMLGSLAMLALLTGTGGPYFERGTTIGGLSVVTAAALSPWLTMLCRSPLAGIVFAIGMAGGLHLVSLGMLMAWLELGGTLTMNLQLLFDRVLAASLLIATAAGAVGGWQAFLRLEADDGRDAHLGWPQWLRSRMALDDEALVMPARRSMPTWLLLKKELRIQQLSMVVAGINVLIWIATSAVVRPDPASTNVMAFVAVLYGVLLAVLIGALASAEERRLGTLEWQTLLPVPAWRQFFVKTAVAVTLSLILAFALPLLLARGEWAVTAAHAVAVVLLTIGSLYVSSRCSSGLQAMAVSMAALFAFSLLLASSTAVMYLRPNTMLAAGAALAVVALRLAMLNHRTARS